MWVPLLTLHTDTFHSLIYTEEAGSNDGETRRVTGRVNLVRARGRETPVPYSSLDTEPIISLSRQYVLKHGDMTGATGPASSWRIVQIVQRATRVGVCSDKVSDWDSDVDGRKGAVKNESDSLR